MKKSDENSYDLGLSIFYKEYPEYFDTLSNIYFSNEKDMVIEKLLHKYAIKNVFRYMG